MADTVVNPQSIDLHRRRKARFDASKFLSSYKDYIANRVGIEEPWDKILPAVAFSYECYPSLKKWPEIAEGVLSHVADDLYGLIKRQRIPVDILPGRLRKFMRKAVRYACLNAFTARSKGAHVPPEWRPEVPQWGSSKWTEDQIYLRELPALLEDKLKASRRITDERFREAALYVARKLIKGDKVPLTLVKTMWDGNAKFLRDWVLVTIRRTLMELRKEDGDLLSLSRDGEGIIFE